MGLLGDDAMTLSTYEFQKTHNFECLLPPIGFTDPLIVSTLVQDISYSDYVMTPNKMTYGPYESYFAGPLAINEFTITFKETTAQDVKTYIGIWRDLVLDNQGRYKVKLGYGTGYAKTIVLNYLSGGNVNDVLFFINAFPLGYNPLNLSYKSADIQEITVRFICDSIQNVELGINEISSLIAQNT